MMFLHSLTFILLAFGMLFLFGLGPVLTLLPPRFRVYALFVAPATGYVVFCFFTILASGLTHLPLAQTNGYVLIGLLVWSLIALTLYRRELPDILSASKWIPISLVVMLVVIFFPVLDQGIGLYLGTVNPDFSQSVAFTEALKTFNLSFWIYPSQMPHVGVFINKMFPYEFQARFGGVAYSVMIDQVFGLPARASLLTAIVSFLLCLPLTVYFFSRAVLEFKQTPAVLSMLMITTAAAISMSFIHTFIGQNSALPVFPLAISFIYLAIHERSVRLAVLSAIIINGIFWLYVMALPYVIAPFGLYFLLDLFACGRKNFNSIFSCFLVIAGISLVVHLTMASITVQFVRDLLLLLGSLAQSHYYSDFLIEDVFVYANGLSSYPIIQNEFIFHFSKFMIPALKLLSFILPVVYFLSLHQWSKSVSKDSVRLVVSLVSTYMLVWFYYTFITRYGYASFKMAAWLQFIVVPFIAWFILEKIHFIKKTKFSLSWPLMSSYFVAIVLLSYVVMNLLSIISYSKKSYANDRAHGSLINSYSVAHNVEYLQLPEALRPFIHSKNTVALGFGDTIENFWVSYYLGKMNIDIPVRMLTHEEMPDDDAYLPDIHTRKVSDSFGHSKLDQQLFFHNGIADYYLLAGPKNLDNDIVLNTQKSKPLWSSDTFALYKATDVFDLVVTGRGFFRTEYMSDEIPWWWPTPFRWTEEGGEIYHFRPSLPHQPYRLQFSAISGIGLKSGVRTLEIWHNGKKFDEVLIDGAARIQTKPYYPIVGVNRLVIKIKERAELSTSHVGLWNKDLSRRTRQINMLLGDVLIINKNTPVINVMESNKVFQGKSLFKHFNTFNGFDVDGWVRDKAELSIRVDSAVRMLRVSFFVPGIPEFKFPYKVDLRLNGVVHHVEFKYSGEHEVELKIPPLTSVKNIILEIYPSQVKQLFNGLEQRESFQSIRLNSLELLTNSRP